jgi:arylsulfate sulfotransferase
MILSNYKMNHNLHNSALVRVIAVAVTALLLSLQLSNATQADDTSIVLVSKSPGPTPFIRNLNFQVNPIANIQSVQFTIQPKAGSVTRPISATYSSRYLSSRGYLDTAGSMKIPVFGLYDGLTNSVTLNYVFRDGSSTQHVFSVLAPVFRDPCHYNERIEVLPRTDSTRLSYDFMLLKNQCDDHSPAVMDTDGALRWVGSAGASELPSAFIDNAMYVAYGPQLLRIELDGVVSLVADYSNLEVLNFHHNMDPGKFGLLVEVDTRTDTESIIMEVGLRAGHVIKKWNMASIIASAMRAGGDDPSAFVRRGEDWFHSNAATYRASDNSVIISSRENFVIALDWSTGAIKWILGDPTKAWYQYASLRAYALNVQSGGLAPIGQHAVSITYNDNLLLFDDGLRSFNQNPPGNNRRYAAPRKYSLDLMNHAATEIYRYTRPIVSEICSSVYEDAPNNYLVDYAVAGGYQSGNAFAEIVGLQPNGARVFDYKFATNFCDEIFNAIPVHFEQLTF